MAHIITYGTMATKLAIKDVARVQKLPLSESDRLCKLVPDKIPDKKMNLPNAIAYVPELQAAEVSPDPILRDTIKYAKMLEGNVRLRRKIFRSMLRGSMKVLTVRQEQRKSVSHRLRSICMLLCWHGRQTER